MHLVDVPREQLGRVEQVLRKNCRRAAQVASPGPLLEQILVFAIGLVLECGLQVLLAQIALAALVQVFDLREQVGSPAGTSSAR